MKKLLSLAAAALLLGAGCSASSNTNVQTGTSVNPATNPNAPQENVGTQGDHSADVQVDASVQTAATIQGFSFSPSSITVKKGAKISFTNHDPVTHTVTADAGAFESGSITTGSTYTLDTSTLAAGTYTYHCTPHPNMKGTIIVQ